MTVNKSKTMKIYTNHINATIKWSFKVLIPFFSYIYMHYNNAEIQKKSCKGSIFPQLRR